ncbi:ACP S-malonyltransferase [Marinicella litoralis]|uniref:Malonyl CoA-acyl carrier protein transacylase n=1 Tax=Marinicella litoralis TaxID=644220 RepID=A0A4R6XK15_9GAMM|nr:ACP S-malonyltransferase [Marinicella litoralis]TDR16308.1 [acyl-carrier-protein] S-malonyltransferase [Marinicella litoralis]
MNKIAFVFPGQGSQSVGMLDGLTEYTEIIDCFTTANEVLDVDLLKMVNEGPVDELNQTQWTQPALLATSVGIFRAIRARKEFDISVLAGHSLGEYSALVCAGSLSLETALKLVHKRGLYMQQAVPSGQGSMAAVLGLEAALVEQACQQAQAEMSGSVSPANYNSPEQIVIAGSVAEVTRASELCVAAGAKKVMPLAVSVPSHCALMKSAADRLAVDLEAIELTQPELPILHNVDVKSHQDQAVIKQLLVQQLYSPVRWTQTMEAFQAIDIEMVVECGPGKVLSGLFKRFDRSLKTVPLLNAKGIESIIEE